MRKIDNKINQVLRNCRIQIDCHVDYSLNCNTFNRLSDIIDNLLDFQTCSNIDIQVYDKLKLL